MIKKQVMHSKLIVALAILLIGTMSCHKKHDEPTGNTHAFIHTSGTDILDANGNKIYLRGVAFGNEVWSNVEVPTTHHSEADYGRVHDMGMNAVRFYMNYKTFEDDANPYVYKKTGWDWIDLNIAWAKAHNVYLILNMHVPQGGFQSNGNGGALWNDQANQDRLKALWFNIAKRYANEPTIAAFDLLNEPVVTTSISQWSTLAQDIVDTIRTVNANQMIIVERVNAVGSDWSNNSDMNFFDLKGDNIAYEFHFYQPMEFTHQGASWISPVPAIGQTYPDPSRIYITGSSGFYTASFSNPTLAAGTYDWTQYVESPKFTVNDPLIKLAKPTFVNRENTGKVWIDDIVVKEYDATGAYVQTILSIDVTSFDGWYYWSQDLLGTAGTDNTTGHSNSNSIYVEGSTSDANLSNSKYYFIPKQGYSYTVGGWVKGEAVTSGSKAMFRLDFEKLSTGGSAYALNKDYLAAQVDQYYNWTQTKNRPLFLGEFGAIQFAYDNDLGGVQWTGDMIDILKARNAHFTYHCYHEDNFGIYRGSGTIDPSNCNQPLIDLFKSKLP
ncbi:glycoside hydrolase family 5 protein [Cytophaga aurantiaca]|uniref:glycoside hydrolase family 5 protein n=1 Tax=Cytophaga aurantiaca TaxID=29530 RepID=UPI00037ADE9E|nr:cellulase family glycosylhydrolase [Cytophaga aurantiaca]